MEAGYSINIAGSNLPRDTGYSHFCRVDAGPSERHARVVLAAMRRKFQAPEWKVEMTLWSVTGKTVA